MKSIIEIKFQLVDITEAHVDFEKFEEELLIPFDTAYESTDFSASIIKIELR